MKFVFYFVPFLLLKISAKEGESRERDMRMSGLGLGELGGDLVKPGLLIIY